MTQVEATDPFHGTEANLRFSLTMYWDVNTLEWVKGTQASGGGGGTSTEYTQDAAAPANPVGPVQNVVRVDTPSAVGADGDIVTQKGTAYGAAYVTLLDASGATPTIGGGVQYTEGDTDASITGTALMMEGAGNALVAAPGTAADGLLVNLGSNNDVTVAGTVAVTQSGTWDEVGINDSGNSITVDAPVGTPVFARLSDGAAALIGQAASSASLPVTVASDQTPVPVGNYAVSSTTSFTRPADTTAYAVGDVVCNSTSAPTVLTFTSMARSNGGSGTILGAALILGSNPATKPIYDLFLFNSSPSIDNDNATFTPTDSEMLACVAVIPLGAPVVGDTTGTSTSLYYSWDGAKAYVTSGATSLYGVLVARNAVTPSSADTYNFRIVAARD